MRGGRLVILGLSALAFGWMVGVGVQRTALRELKNANPRDILERFEGLTFFSGIANLTFYGGIVVSIGGFVLMIMQSRESLPSPLQDRTESLEDENRRLRQELENLRLRQELEQMRNQQNV